MCPGGALNRDPGDWMDAEDEREGESRFLA